jgi:DNA-binding XRE family transcriptional regulator
VTSVKKKSFGDLIRRRRRQLNLTQQEVAIRIKISVQYVGRLEAGKRHPSPKLVGKLADVLELDGRELFFLASPATASLISGPSAAEGSSAWTTFSSDATLRKLHRITDQEFAILSKVATMGDVRCSRDLIFVLNAIRYALGR